MNYYTNSFSCWNDILLHSSILSFLDSNTLLALCNLNRDCLNTLRAHSVWLSTPFAKYGTILERINTATPSTTTATSPTHTSSNIRRTTSSSIPRSLSFSSHHSIPYTNAFYIRQLSSYYNEAKTLWKMIDNYYSIISSIEWEKSISFTELEYITKKLNYPLHPSLVSSLLIRNGNIQDHDIVSSHAAFYGARLLNGLNILKYKLQQPIPPGLYFETENTNQNYLTTRNANYMVPISDVFGYKQLWIDNKFGTVYLCQPLHNPIIVSKNFIYLLKSVLE